MHNIVSPFLRAVVAPALQRALSLPLRGGESASAIALDPPVSAALLSKTIAAYGFDRLVEGFAGPTVTIRRLSDNAQQAFGCTGSGRFDWRALSAWLSGADADVVSFADQRGGATALAAVAGSTLALVRSGIVQRLGTAMNTADGQLTRSASEGGVGVNLGGAGMLQTATLPVTVSTDSVGIHLLWSPNNRKRANNDGTDPLPGDNVRENICCYGQNSNNQMIAYMGGGAATDFCRMQSGGQQNQTSGKQASGTYRYKARAQYVTSYVMSAASFSEIEHGKRTKNIALNAATTSAIQGGSMDNGVLGIGGVFAGTGSSALDTNFRGNLLFAGVILTKNLTATERFFLQARLGAIGQQHRVRAKSDIEAMFDEIVDMRDINPATGRVTGKKGLLTVDFNLSGSAFTVGAVNAVHGLTGLASGSNAVANSFQATTNWFHDNLSGSVLSLRYLASGPQNNNLQWDFGMSAGSPQADTRADASLMVGYHHAVPAIGTKPALSVDPLPRMGTRRTGALAQFGATIYDLVNQTLGKYNYFCACIGMVYNEVFSGWTWDKASWENTNAGAPYPFDAPVGSNTPENLQYPFKPDQVQLQISTFEPPAGYVPGAALAAREPYYITGKARCYVSGGGIQPIGHMDGSFAASDNTGIRHADAGHRIQSNPYQYQMMGDRYLWAFRRDKVFTLEEAEIVQVNAYKLVA